ncbi:MAG: ATP-binding protein [Clostridia bacterium]|nr:ATP-binding protein [Clostridia bacterium]
MSTTRFVGRTRELQELENRFASGRKEFGVIYGRRRIGKSELIRHFLMSKKSLMFQAKKDNAYGNLRSFSYELNKQLGQPKGFVYSSWEEALDAVTEYAGEERFVLAIDEYPYIVEQDGSFPSVMQEFIDRSGENLFLLISGSDVSMLKNEIKDHASPLYKRRTFEMSIRQLPFREALGFLEGYENEVKCDYLALMSTFPYYLAAIDGSKSFDENIRNLMFNQYGTFFTLPDQLLSNATKVQDVYNAILMAIAHRRHTNKEIADYIHEEEAKVAKYMVTLLESELVIKNMTFMGNKKTLYYEIGDPLLKLWYRFIFDNQERIRTNGDKVYESMKNEIKTFICHGFEEVCRLYIDQMNMDCELPEVFEKPRVYRVEKSVLGRSVELDGLSLANGILLVMECKYRQTPFTKRMLEHLVESASVFPDKYRREYYLFSKNGFESGLQTDTEQNMHCFDLKRMFEEEPMTVSDRSFIE